MEVFLSDMFAVGCLVCLVEVFYCSRRRVVAVDRRGQDKPYLYKYGMRIVLAS